MKLDYSFMVVDGELLVHPEDAPTGGWGLISVWQINSTPWLTKEGAIISHSATVFMSSGICYEESR